MRLLRAGLPHIFDRAGQAKGTGVAGLCAPTKAALPDSLRRCTETIAALCHQTLLLSDNIAGAQALSLRELPDALPEARPRGEPRRLRGVGFVAACGCSDAKPLAIISWRSAACYCLWMQSTLLYDSRRLHEHTRAVLLENVVVFRQGLASATRGRLEETWLPLAEPTPLAPGMQRPLPWFPGAALSSPFDIDVLIVFDGKAPLVPSAHVVFLDEELAAHSSAYWPEGAVVPTEDPRGRTGSRARLVEFVFACFPEISYEASAHDGDALVEICSRALERDGLPLVPLETVLDQYIPVVEGGQLSWLTTDRCPPRILLRHRRAFSGAKAPRRTPELERLHGAPSFEMRLLEALRGRLQTSAAKAGLGFVLNPLIWWSLAKLHYRPGRHRTQQVTDSFFPLAERAWSKERQGAPQASKAREAQRSWAGFLAAADSYLAEEQGRAAVLSSWLRLLNTPLGAALVRLLDESVTYFVTECAANLERAQEHVEGLQKILFAFHGFVPLCFTTWDPQHLDRWKTFGVVPHSNATFLRSPKLGSRAPHGHGLYIEHLTLIGLLTSPPSLASSASRLARARGAALASLVETLHGLIFTRRCKQRPELFPAVVFVRSQPMPGVLSYWPHNDSTHASPRAESQSKVSGLV